MCMSENTLLSQRSVVIVVSVLGAVSPVSWDPHPTHFTDKESQVQKDSVASVLSLLGSADWAARFQPRLLTKHISPSAESSVLSRGTVAFR